MSVKSRLQANELPSAMLGTMTMGNQCTEEESHALLDTFVNELGGTFIDTAELYATPTSEELVGRTEEIIGRWLAKNKDKREKILLASKVAGPWPTNLCLVKRPHYLAGDVHAMEKYQDLTKGQIRHALECSLVKLQTDYLDLFQVHWPSRPVPLWGQECFTHSMSQGMYSMRPDDAPPDPVGVDFEPVVQVMGELVAQGKIRAWGLSNETPFGVVRFCEQARKMNVDLPISIQNDFSLVDRRFEGGLAEASAYYGMKLIAYGALCGGVLTGKYLADADPSVLSGRPKSEWRHVKFPSYQPRYHAPKTMQAVTQYASLAKHHGLRLSHVALGFCATRFYVGSTIIGANTRETLIDNYQAVSKAKQTMTHELLQGINNIHAASPNPSVDYVNE